jgi:L-amino acid N-acyltransferase YncA
MTAMDVRIRTLAPEDWPQVRQIYAEGIATGHATFERSAPSWEDWDAGHLAEHRFVATIDDAVVGWAALSPVSERCVYAGVAEVSVYVAARVRGQGVGVELLNRLVASSEASDIWTLQAGIFPENTGSLALHRRCGFRIVGTRERLGRLNSVWRDVLLLERRRGGED